MIQEYEGQVWEMIVKVNAGLMEAGDQDFFIYQVMIGSRGVGGGVVVVGGGGSGGLRD